MCGPRPKGSAKLYCRNDTTPTAHVENNARVVASLLSCRGFDGIDWDIEGNDNETDAANYFSPGQLNLMGEMSALARADGFAVSLTPCESYLDVSTPAFDL